MATQRPGRLTIDDLRQEVDDERIDTVIVAFTDLYGRSLGKRYDARFFLEQAAKEGSHVCDYLFTADVGMDPVPGYEFANWERGYGDVHLVPDLSTLRVASWLDRTALVLCDVRAKDHELLDLAPRTILRRQISALDKLGFESRAASELEFFLFETPYREAAKSGYRDLEAAGWYIEDYHLLQGMREEGFVGEARRHLHASGVPVETSKGEWGLGQHELNVRYAAPLEMADRHAVYKQCLRELAVLQGKSVTFMAKPFADQAGSSCHLHVSLTRDGKSAFAGEETLGPVRCTETFRHFLGGWIAHLPDFFVFYAPTINSYKRYQAASWAPTKLAWAYDNRTAGFRVVGSGESLRIECRVAGADCNPYLAFAASLAAGLEGIEKRIEPPPMFEGDVYAAAELPAVPATLEEALERFEASALARRVLGEAAHAHYVHFYRNESDAYKKAVTDWERARYFEQI